MFRCRYLADSSYFIIILIIILAIIICIRERKMYDMARWKGCLENGCVCGSLERIRERPYRFSQARPVAFVCDKEDRNPYDDRQDCPPGDQHSATRCRQSATDPASGCNDPRNDTGQRPDWYRKIPLEQFHRASTHQATKPTGYQKPDSTQPLQQ